MQATSYLRDPTPPAVTVQTYDTFNLLAWPGRLFYRDGQSLDPMEYVFHSPKPMVSDYCAHAPSLMLVFRQNM